MSQENFWARNPAVSPALQSAAAWGFGIYSLSHTLVTLVSVSISWAVSFIVFAALVASIQFDAYRKTDVWNTAERTYKCGLGIVYSQWAFAMSVLVWLTWREHLLVWSESDTMNSAVIGSSAVIVLAVTRTKGWSLSHPYTKAGLALCFKAVSQCFYAYQVGHHDRTVDLIALAIGHGTILVRLIPTAYRFFVNPENRNDQAQISTLVAETGNEVSWALVTIARFS